MSKQLKLKFKKILKKAEFIHADLEYHQELFPEAKNQFSDAVNKAYTDLPEEVQHTLTEMRKQNMIRHEQHIKETARKREESYDEDEPPPDEAKDESANENDISTGQEKHLKLKKIFRKIAARTHPDKVGAAGNSDQEIQRYEIIFKKAQSAYQESNWYVLYSIALKLEIDVEDLSDEHIDWVEESIRGAMATIATQNNLLAWRWYIGNDEDKDAALKDYFKQVFNFDFTH